MYNVKFVFLSFYVVLWKDVLLNHAMLFDGFVHLEAFVTPG